MGQRIVVFSVQVITTYFLYADAFAACRRRCQERGIRQRTRAVTASVAAPLPPATRLPALLANSLSSNHAQQSGQPACPSVHGAPLQGAPEPMGATLIAATVRCPTAALHMCDSPGFCRGSSSAGKVMSCQ